MTQELLLALMVLIRLRPRNRQRLFRSFYQ